MRIKITVELEGEPNIYLEVTEQQVARLLGMPQSTICMMRHQGRGPKVHHFEGKVSPRYRLIDVIRFAQKQVRVSFRGKLDWRERNAG